MCMKSGAILQGSFITIKMDVDNERGTHTLHLTKFSFFFLSSLFFLYRNG